jgi:hypothetical protein
MSAADFSFAILPVSRAHREAGRNAGPAVRKDSLRCAADLDVHTIVLRVSCANPKSCSPPQTDADGNMTRSLWFACDPPHKRRSRAFFRGARIRGLRKKSPQCKRYVAAGFSRVLESRFRFWWPRTGRTRGGGCQPRRPARDPARWLDYGVPKGSSTFCSAA